MTETEVLRAHAEDAFADELTALAKADERPRPPGWKLSPWAVVSYLVGGTLDDGTEISAKYIGRRRLIEVAVASLATDRALLLLGVRARQDLGRRAPRGGDLGRFDAAGAGNQRHRRGGDPLRLGLRAADRQGPLA